MSAPKERRAAPVYRPMMRRIQEFVADQMKVTVTDILSRRRGRACAHPRHVAMYLCRAVTHHSLPEIGRAFNRDHTTVMNACRLVAGRMESDRDFRALIARYVRRLDGGLPLDRETERLIDLIACKVEDETHRRLLDLAALDQRVLFEKLMPRLARLTKDLP